LKQSKNNTIDYDVNNKNVISAGFWDRAIAEAKGQLNYFKIREARLKLAIKIFEANKSNGECPVSAQ
jgi:hypothetical protein